MVEARRWRLWWLAGRPAMLRSSTDLRTWRAPWADLAPAGWPGRDPGDLVEDSTAAQVLRLFDQVPDDPEFAFGGAVAPLLGGLVPGRVVVGSGRAGLVEVAGALVSPAQLLDPAEAARVVGRLLVERIRRYPPGAFSDVTVAAWADPHAAHAVAFDPTRRFGQVRRTLVGHRPVLPGTAQDPFVAAGAAVEVLVGVDTSSRLARHVVGDLYVQHRDLHEHTGGHRVGVVAYSTSVGRWVPLGGSSPSDPRPLSAAAEVLDAAAGQVRAAADTVALGVVVRDGPVPWWAVVTADDAVAFVPPGRFVPVEVGDVDLRLLCEQLAGFAPAAACH